MPSPLDSCKEADLVIGDAPLDRGSPPFLSRNMLHLLALVAFDKVFLVKLCLVRDSGRGFLVLQRTHELVPHPECCGDVYAQGIRDCFQGIAGDRHLYQLIPGFGALVGIGMSRCRSRW